MQTIQKNQKFNQIIINRGAGGLYHKTVPAAYILFQLDQRLAIGEWLHFGLADRNADIITDLLRKIRIGTAAEYN